MENIVKKTNKQWNLLFDDDQDQVASAAVSELASALRVTHTTAKLLYLRGYRSVSEAERFFRLEEAEPHDPFLLKDMEKAVSRVRLALERKERIAIYGDYDVDGVTATSLLYLYLSEYGADVLSYIPSRSKEGYGLSESAIDYLQEKGVKLIITVDTGITAVEEIAYAESLGIDTVVTDHHECLAELPRACAVVNPHRADDAYPFLGLAGVGVAFKLVCAMEMQKCEREGTSALEGVLRLCNDYADLVAVGTIADVMPVTDENRLFIAKGISNMETNCRLGLKALIDASGTNRGSRRNITSSFIGFVLAPRINAAGRVADASVAVDLLLTDQKERADALAKQLCELNSERQTEENRIVQEAYRKIEALPEEDRREVLVIDSDDWHQGVIGIVSSRLTEQYGLPSILITYDGTTDDIGKGSGRSVKGLNLVEALAACSDLLVRYGGHELAAGLSIRRRDVSRLRSRLNDYAAEHFSGADHIIQIDADCEISARDLTMRLAEEVGMLEPFGIGNATPNFILRDATVLKIAPIGGGKHVRLLLEKDGVSATAVWFGKCASELPFSEGEIADFLFQISINEFNGIFSVQMLLQDASVARSEQMRMDLEKERFQAILSGATYTADENILPDRNDIAVVYRFLRKETENGHTSFPVRRLLSSLNRQGVSFTYGKIRVILCVLRELHLCDYAETVPDHFIFEFCDCPIKTDLERSEMLSKFRSQLQKSPPKERCLS